MLIGLMGYGGVGKSTVVHLLCEHHGFVVPHIGAPSKSMLGALLHAIGYDAPTIASYLGATQAQPRSRVWRDHYRGAANHRNRSGSNCIRHDNWLSLWLVKTDAILTAGGRVVQESVRFPDEAEAIKAQGGLLMAIRRPRYGPLSAHTSKCNPAIPDATIMNTGCITSLARKIGEALVKNSSAEGCSPSSSC